MIYIDARRYPICENSKIIDRRRKVVQRVRLRKHDSGRIEETSTAGGVGCEDQVSKLINRRVIDARNLISTDYSRQFSQRRCAW
jgi:hypothetical protein